MELDNLILMARYNSWAIQRLNLILDQVIDEDFYRDNGLFFRSIFGTLNHLLVGEHALWFSRFSLGHSPQMALNSIIEQDRYALTQTLLEKSYHWQDYLHKLDPTLLSGLFHYQTSTGQDISVPFASTLLHVFNHGTHHRGQITAALTAMGYECPELDLIFMLRNEQFGQP
ncbi:damage-inducible protein DinB [Acinetobacter sp. ANC 5054]|uniref:DinB family protein n=1 Tax=Acinetobacter sp. ANC 5054 TaxID=1977877 RepID=UPI000A33A7B6|nr:DinB family protein [Acinetobacter sp. ANC 5054]OTG80138.1 damage-inducible protein DinB [Acinetobacter sp. ANC 5054]